MAHVVVSIRCTNNHGLDLETCLPWDEITKQVFKLSKQKEKQEEIVLSFCDPEEIKTLNRGYRHKDYVTDVLSFNTVGELEEFDLGTEQCLGDIVICVDKALEQAQENGHDLKQELAFLFVHGVLHLLGYDHEEDDKEAELMFKLQDQILESLLI